MIRVNARQLTDQLMRQVRHIDRRKVNKALARALNRAITQAKTFANRKVREEYTVKAGEFAKRLAIKKATPEKLWASMQANHRPMSLRMFKARQLKKGVKFAIHKGKDELMPGTFMKSVSNGFTGVFARGRYKKKDFAWGKNRLPIQGLNSSSAATLVKNKKVLGEVKAKVKADYEARAQYELSKLVNPSS